MKKKTNNLIIEAQMEIYAEWESYFRSIGNGRIYTNNQKHFAFEKINEFGIRATSRILKISRRTLQRWCRKDGIYVKRCPFWVYEWAERRRKKREFWSRKGYC